MQKQAGDHAAWTTGGAAVAGATGALHAAGAAAAKVVVKVMSALKVALHLPLVGRLVSSTIRLHVFATATGLARSVRPSSITSLASPSC